jgi:hypothetical protein
MVISSYVLDFCRVSELSVTSVLLFGTKVVLTLAGPPLRITFTRCPLKVVGIGLTLGSSLGGGIKTVVRA